MQGQIQRFKTTAGLLPALPTASCGQQLQHGTIKTIPEGASKAGLLAADGGKGRAGDHHLGALTAKQVENSGLDCWISETADPDQTRPKATLPQGQSQLLSQCGVTRLQLGPVEHDTNGGTDVVLPVPGEGVR